MRLPTVLLDVFAVTLFLYILYTVMALSALLETPEYTLPPIELGTAKAQAGMQRTEPVAVTVSESATQEIIYHLNDAVISRVDLRARLHNERPQAVTVRIDNQIRFAQAMPLFALLAEQRIANVTLAYGVALSLTVTESHL